MSIRTSLSAGYARMVRTPRLIAFAWVLNIILAMVIALPVYGMLDDALRGSVYEQILMERMDQNWWLSFKEDHAENPLAGLLDLTIMGAAPFLTHLDTMVRGGMALPFASLLSDLLLEWQVPDPVAGVLLLLGLLGVFVHAVLAAGFISAYRGEYPPTISQFLADAMHHLGPFVRLSFLVFLLQAIVLYPVIGSVASWIRVGTQDSPSELTPFLLYMGRNLLAFALLFFLTLSADYARVHIVVQGRTGALSGLLAGIRFVASHGRLTSGVGFLLVLASIGLMIIYGLVEFLLPKDSALAVLLLFTLHQTYIIGRSAIRAMTYAAEVDVFQTSGMRS